LDFKVGNTYGETARDHRSCNLIYARVLHFGLTQLHFNWNLRTTYLTCDNLRQAQKVRNNCTPSAKTESSLGAGKRKKGEIIVFDAVFIKIMVYFAP
jgi:hypothetical protein